MPAAATTGTATNAATNAGTNVAVSTHHHPSAQQQNTLVATSSVAVGMLAFFVKQIPGSPSISVCFFFC
jgi:hypothetical protein